MTEAGVITLKGKEDRPFVRQDTIGVLDIGSTKMCCLVGRSRPGAELELLGASYQLAEGLKAGEIVDVEAVEASILAVVHEAEQQAGETLRDVVLGVTAGRPVSKRTVVDVELGGRAVTSSDLSRALSEAEKRIHEAEQACLHAIPVEMTLDGGQPLKDPRGMIGRRLSVETLLVEVAAAPLRNLVAAVERCHLDVVGVVANAYAAGLASLSEEEMALGALVLDLGGGVTGAARFSGGKLQEILSLPVGAQHVTQDLAFGLSIGRDQAERLKTLYGSALEHAGDSHERIEVPGIGDPTAPPSQIVTRAKLTEIIRPRVEEVFHIVREQLGDRMPPLAGRRLVLTGGGSQLEGTIELAEEVFDMPARLGRARPLSGRTQFDDLSAATTAAGLLLWTGRDDGGLTYRSPRPT
ncbi:MAG: cell division protein FtsA, partial [Geminicoccaceae bacterium]